MEKKDLKYIKIYELRFMCVENLCTRDKYQHIIWTCSQLYINFMVYLKHKTQTIRILLVMVTVSTILQ